jgi:fibronectin-binding autotransporter adhesin
LTVTSTTQVANLNVATSGSVANGTSSVNIATVNGNVTLVSVGNTTMTVTGTGANITGTLNASGNSNVGNLGTGGLVTATGNIQSTAFLVGANLSVTGNSNIGNIGTGGLITATGNITGANLIGPLASGNSNISITSNSNISMFVNGNATARFVVTNTGANIAGTLSVSGVSNLGPVGNVTITGGSSGQVLSTDGSGALSFISVSSSGISNGTSNVNIPAVNGNVNISSAGNANVLVITDTGANINGTLSISGNAIVGNLSTGGAGGNIANANVISANTFSAAGNITGANLVVNTSGFMKLASFTATALTAITGQVGWIAAVSNSPTSAGRLAYWSTTATASWRYVDDNTAV